MKDYIMCFFFFSSRRRHTRLQGDWSSNVCSSDLIHVHDRRAAAELAREDGHPDEARGLVLRRDGQHGLSPALEPRAARRDPPGGRVAHGDVERSDDETADAAAPVAVR